MAFLIPLQVLLPISLVIIIAIAVSWILFNKNKKLAGKLISEKLRFNRYKKGVESLKNNPTTPKKDFESLNQYVRAFFKEYLNLSYSLTYLELEGQFKKQKKLDYAKFCKLMSDVNYKGQKKDATDIIPLISMFSKILKGY